MSEIDVLRIDKEGKRNIKDMVIEEISLTMYLNGKKLLMLLCSPANLQELSAGFLYSAGLIKSINDIKAITIDGEKQVSYIELNTKEKDTKFIFKRLTSNSNISSEKILTLMDSFEKRSFAFRQTGGVHSAALSNTDKILVFKEDIGRHNALDKVIGEALIRGVNMKDLVILTSGRISTEIISKVEKTRAVFLISRSAPTNQAIKLAKELNLTLIGFARGKRMNVYAADERVV